MKKYLGLFVGLVLLVPITAFGAEFRGSDETLNSTETIQDNLYVAGNNFNLMGTVEGDLIAGGGTINVLGTVTGDVLVFGGTINISGRIGGDVRVVGGTILINGQVGGEVIAAGGDISVVSGASIVKGAYLFGGKVIMDGLVGKNLEIRSSEISLGSTAKIAGNFDYYSSKEANIVSGAKINGDVVFHPEQIKKTTYSHRFPWLAFMTFWWFAGIIGATILAWLLFYLWTSESKEMVAAAMTSPGRELLRGFVLLFMIPIAAIICLVTVIGAPLAIMGGFFFASLVVLAAAVSALLVASLIAKFLFNKKDTELSWWLILLGVLAIAIIKLIPLVGWIISFLIYLVAFGILANKIYTKLLPNK